MQRSKIAVILLSLFIIFSGRLVSYMSNNLENQECTNSLNNYSDGWFTPFLKVDITMLSGWRHNWQNYLKNYWESGKEEIQEKNEGPKSQGMAADTTWLPDVKSEMIFSEKKEKLIFNEILWCNQHEKFSWVVKSECLPYP